MATTCGAIRFRSARPRSHLSWPRLAPASGSTSISKATAVFAHAASRAHCVQNPSLGIVRTAASPLGIEVSASEILGAEDIAPAIATIAKQADALFVLGEPLTFTHRTRINTLALAARLSAAASAGAAATATSPVGACGGAASAALPVGASGAARSRSRRTNCARYCTPNSFIQQGSDLTPSDLRWVRSAKNHDPGCIS
jgi:hypothetical protein